MRFAIRLPAVLLVLALAACRAPAQPPAAAATTAAVNGDRAMEYLVQICDIGPRISGSEGMARQQQLIEEHFRQLGAEVRYQEFDIPHPQTGVPVRMKNMVIAWHPEARERVILCSHYDTRPRADQEPLEINRNQPFLSANDGGSGVALLMELGHHMKSLSPRWGVDFVFFDGEELIYNQQTDKYFHGSQYFSVQYRDHPPANYRYVGGVLLDMVAGKNLKLYYEVNSLKLAPEITRSVWATAQKLGVREFIPRARHEILDDHLQLNQIAKIPTTDLIDFDYPFWHRRNDLPVNCSGESMAKVGKVLLAWLEQAP